MKINPVVGSKQLVRFEKVDILCHIRDVATTYGRVRMEVEPVNGKGAQWVESTRLRSRPQNGQ